MIQPTTPEKTHERKPSCWTKVASDPERPAHNETVALTVEIDVERSSESLGFGYRAPETSSTPARSWDEQDHSYTFQPTAGGPWDTRELYVFNTCAFTIYHLKLAITLKTYVIPKDDTSTALSDDTVSEILTDLKQNEEKMDCANLRAQVEEANPEIIREMAEKKEIIWFSPRSQYYLIPLHHPENCRVAVQREILSNLIITSVALVAYYSWLHTL